MPLTNAVRRTTIVCRDREASLRFYRDILGWQVFYDAETVPRTGEVLGVRCSAVHMTVLRADDDQVGMIGLIHFREPDPPLDHPPTTGPVRAGEAYLMMTTHDFDAVHAALAAVAPVIMPVMPDDLRGDGPREFAVRDPDGVVVVIIDRGPRL